MRIMQQGLDSLTGIGSVVLLIYKHGAADCMPSYIS